MDKPGPHQKARVHSVLKKICEGIKLIGGGPRYQIKAKADFYLQASASINGPAHLRLTFDSNRCVIVLSPKRKTLPILPHGLTFQDMYIGLVNYLYAVMAMASKEVVKRQTFIKEAGKVLKP